MDNGKLSGSYFDAGASRRTYRYEATYQLDGNTLCYASKVWCGCDLKGEPRGSIGNVLPGSCGNDARIRRELTTAMKHFARIDAGIDATVVPSIRKPRIYRCDTG